MPVTGLDIPILQQFLCVVEHRTGVPAQPLIMESPSGRTTDPRPNDTQMDKPLPKGVVLGPDGKPCRSCTSVRAWMAMSKQKPNSGSDASNTAKSVTSSLDTAESSLLPADCPPDVEQLGRSTWTLLHTMTANYPERPSLTRQIETRQFMGLFGKMYPCWVCADDFRAWIADGHEPRVSNREEFGKWMCEAHNAVNVKLGKPSFDCNKWEERWRTGWKDGRCD